MIKLTPLLTGLLACCLLSCSNNTSNKTTDTPQSNTYLVSMDGLDSLKLDMNTAEIEKLLKSKIVFRHIGHDYSPDTIQVKYKGMDVTLYMDGSDDTTATLRAIQTTHPDFKTSTGLGTGSTKNSVIDAYPDNRRFVGPEYEIYPVRSTTKSIVAVMDTFNTHAILFRVIDRKVVSVEVNAYFEYY